MSEQERAEYRYLVWRAAQALGLRPWQLQGPQRTEVEGRARREFQLIEQALASAEAARVPADAEVVEEAALALAGLADQREVFLAELQRAGLDWATLQEAIGAELRAGILLEQVASRAQVSEDEVRAWYENNRHRLITPELRGVRHILITVNEDYRENGRDAAYARLAGLAERIAVDGQQCFGQLAQANSECPSALQDGWLGQVRRGQLYEALEQSLFAMEQGGVSEVLESPLGFHLLRCDSITPPRQLEYTEAAPTIRQRLSNKAGARAVQQWLRAQTH